MSAGRKVALASARRLAEALVRELEPACERIEIFTPEERDVFAACRVEWMPPHLRRSAADLRAGR